MKTAFKTLLALLLAATLTVPFVACSEDKNENDTTTTTTTASTTTKTTTKLTTLGNNNTDPSTPGDNNNDDPAEIAFVSGDEKAAQTTEMGNLVYWNDQNWNGATVTITAAKVTDGVYEFAFTHTGANWFGAQLFYNPADANNGDVYNVSFKIKSDVDTSITSCGTVYELKANEEQTITYEVTVDMNPEDTNYQYGQSVFDVQFGVEDGNIDIVDGTYIISELVATKQ